MKVKKIHLVLSHICILHLSLSYFRAQLLRARTFLSVSEISWVINDGWSEMGDIIKFDDLFLYKTNAVDHYHSVWQKSVPGFSTQTDNLKEWIGHAIKAGQIQRDPDIFVSCTLCEHAILGSWGLKWHRNAIYRNIQKTLFSKTKPPPKVLDLYHGLINPNPKTNCLDLYETWVCVWDISFWFW